jgi:hypothetical protein
MVYYRFKLQRRPKMATQMIEYGIRCKKEDEKQIVRNINNFLLKEYGYRKMYKWKHNAISTFKYEYHYAQFIKQQPRWFFDIFPNEDMNKKWKFENRETQWILCTIKNDIELYSKEQNEEVNLFFSKLIKAIGFEVIILHEYKEDEERIGNIIYDDDGNEIIEVVPRSDTSELPQLKK